MSARARLVVIAACSAFPIFSHLGATLGEPRLSALGATLLVGVMAVGAFGRVRGGGLTLLFLGLALAGATLFPKAVLYAPPIVLNLAFCAAFAATLQGGREAMVSRFARVERGGELPPDLVRYTRGLTIVWSVFFALMAGISLSLALWGTIFSWSLFTNLGNYVLVVLFFVLEYLYRRVRYRHYEHARPRELIRRIAAYRVFPRTADGR